MDEQTAFEALRRFLANYVARGDQEVSQLLADVSPGLWGDGSPIDPAQWHDWLQAIEDATGTPYTERPKWQPTGDDR